MNPPFPWANTGNSVATFEEPGPVPPAAGEYPWDGPFMGHPDPAAPGGNQVGVIGDPVPPGYTVDTWPGGAQLVYDLQGNVVQIRFPPDYFRPGQPGGPPINQRPPAGSSPTEPVRPTPTEPIRPPTYNPAPDIGGGILAGLQLWDLLNGLIQSTQNCEASKGQILNATGNLSNTRAQMADAIFSEQQNQLRNAMSDPTLPAECRAALADLYAALDDLLRQLAELGSQIRSLSGDIAGYDCFILGIGTLSQFAERGRAIAQAMADIWQQYLALFQEIQDAIAGNCPKPGSRGRCRPGQRVPIQTPGGVRWVICKTASARPGRPTLEP